MSVIPESKIQNSESKIIKVLVTGSNGFVGKNLCSVLRMIESVQLYEFDIANSSVDLERMLSDVDVVVHLAGVNRPKNEQEFITGNAGLTESICSYLSRSGKAAKIVLASSIQAESVNPYGQSKLQAEETIRQYAENSGAKAVVYRFKNLFGKWCRPNYNSVTATFCHNVAHGLPISISDPSRVIELTYIDDVVNALVGEIMDDDSHAQPGFSFAPDLSGYPISLGELADLITSFRNSRETLEMPGFDSSLIKALYATYLSYLDGEEFAYPLTIRSDERGCLAEMMKSRTFGQIFVSRTKPGITRGNHYHHTKTEKFMVVEGEAVIRFRRVDSDEVIEHRVSGKEFSVVDIPPGYTHHITNTGQGELVTLFWASEMFNPELTDTYFMPV
ncbi:NAD-dependent epimerase/dehydratase family protein [Chlorobaculum sp. 24CR]|uniref:polysaccharide biosynthesis C-terminal domain-containing protein n=1 Tax=Chlorobaculum sp. 24CR TaxID=2508878 RepID=UPI001FD71224|nr:NAD-dependent epimerase/dehydratase family protein [Chlorobaculum sp. 24CR]